MFVVSVVVIISTKKVDVVFVGNQPNEFRAGFPLTLCKDVPNAKKVKCVFVRYGSDEKCFTARMLLVDWLRLERGCEYLLTGRELVFLPTVELKMD